MTIASDGTWWLFSVLARQTELGAAGFLLQGSVKSSRTESRAARLQPSQDQDTTGEKNAEAARVGTLFCPFVTSPRQTHLRTCAGDLQAMALGGCSAPSRGNVCALSLANIAPRQSCAARTHGSHLAVRAFCMQYRIIKSSNVGGVGGRGDSF